MSVQHVRVKDGGQAVVGNGGRRGGGDPTPTPCNTRKKRRDAARDPNAMAPCDALGWHVYRMHGARGGASEGSASGTWRRWRARVEGRRSSRKDRAAGGDGE